MNKDYIKLANDLLADNNLYNWKCEVSYDARTWLGITRHSNKRILISNYLLESQDNDNILDTILHEIAHALCGYDEAHGDKWLRTARKLGCTGEVTGNRLAPYVYSAICGDCGYEYNRDTLRNSKFSCKNCGQELVFIKNTSSRENKL